MAQPYHELFDSVRTQAGGSTRSPGATSFDYIRTDGGPWWGRMEEISFLARLYDLEQLPSTDSALLPQVGTSTNTG